jgi:HEAT repeat protein
MTDVNEQDFAAAVNALIAALGYVATAAAEALLALGSTRNRAAVVDAVIVALGDKDRHIREKAAGISGKLGMSVAVKPLVRALKNDPEFQVRQTAATALGALRDPAAVDSLISVAGRSDLAAYVIKALGEIGDSRAVPCLLSLLKAEDWGVRGYAADALAKIPDERAIEPLIAALDDVSAGVVGSAMKALGNFVDGRSSFPSGQPALDKDVLASVLQESESLVNLISQLRNESEKEREEAARKLGEKRKRCAILPLIGLFDDDYVSVRAEAASAVAKLGSASLEPLNHAYLSGNDNVRRSVAQAFGSLPDSAAVKHLCEIAKLCRNYNVRREAAYGLLNREDAGEFHVWAKSIIDSG